MLAMVVARDSEETWLYFRAAPQAANPVRAMPNQEMDTAVTTRQSPSTREIE
jgi:hypothetical protein